MLAGQSPSFGPQFLWVRDFCCFLQVVGCGLAINQPGVDRGYQVKHLGCPAVDRPGGQGDPAGPSAGSAFLDKLLNVAGVVVQNQAQVAEINRRGQNDKVITLRHGQNGARLSDGSFLVILRCLFFAQAFGYESNYQSIHTDPLLLGPGC